DFFMTYIGNDSKDTSEGTEFNMPALVGENWNAVKPQLLNGEFPQAKGIKITVEKVEFKASDDSYGTIYYQDPRAGEHVKLRKDSEYYVVKKLYVSVGKQKAVMPDVINLSVQKAEDRIISEKGLSGSSIIHKIAAEEDYNSSSFVPNQVVRSEPAAGALMDFNGEIILYHTPNIKSSISMPDLYGMKESQAASILSSYNLSYLVEKVESDYPEGYIIGQSVDAYKPVERGTSVTLKISCPLPSVNVIDYGGMNIADVQPVFEEAGITVNVVYEDSAVLEDGTITGQSVVPDTVLKKGGAITFMVTHRIETTAATGTEPTLPAVSHVISE
ncbi:MAG: PASTA domain-containing protein, partial [Clostridia bacterium]|nr:PASTA domain-containing protein [Clostridia bacterium]